MARRVSSLLLAVSCSLLLVGCEALTREEAAAALEELEVSSQAAALTSSSVEISTNFTIGDAAEAAAEELRGFIASQLPCAEISLEGTTLTVEYGVKPGNCTFRGLTYQGTHTVTVMKNDMDEVLVDHAWENFTNGVVEVDGTALVTWSAENKSRSVSYTQTWTRTRDGRTGEGTGEMVAVALEEGITSGFRLDGERDWRGERGEWNLDVDGVEMRWIDAVPQAGRYTLDTPFDKRVTMDFERVGPTEIRVTVRGPRREFSFDVTTLPD